MERKEFLAALNIILKTIGFVIGLVIWFNHVGGKVKELDAIDVSTCSAYCAFGYMVGNCISALVAVGVLSSSGKQQR